MRQRTLDVNEVKRRIAALKGEDLSVSVFGRHLRRYRFAPSVTALSPKRHAAAALADFGRAAFLYYIGFTRLP